MYVISVIYTWFGLPTFNRLAGWRLTSTLLARSVARGNSRRRIVSRFFVPHHSCNPSVIHDHPSLPKLGRDAPTTNTLLIPMGGWCEGGNVLAWPVSQTPGGVEKLAEAP